MSIATEPTLWTDSLGASADVNTLPATSSSGEASIADLFPQLTQVPLVAGGVAPDRKDFNALFKLLGDNVYFQQHGGKYTYNAAYDYSAGAVVLYSGALYICVATNGPDSSVVTPGTDKSYWLQVASSDPWAIFPTGAIMPWPAKTSIPSNWLIMNGQSVSKTTYADLNALINSDSSLDDSGDNTLFIIPDMTDRVWQGCSSYTDVLGAISAGLPNINGGFSLRNNALYGSAGSGAFEISTATGSHNPLDLNAGTADDYINITFLASRYDSIYGNSSTVQPLARHALMIIRA